MERGEGRGERRAVAVASFSPLFCVSSSLSLVVAPELPSTVVGSISGQVSGL